MYISYDASGSPMSITQGSDTYYYVTNIQGDVIAILNSSGTAVAEYVYDAWGNIFSTTGSMATTLGKYNPLRYRGYVYDEEYGLYYLQSRYYNPETGRFLNADVYVSTGQGLLGNNMFIYCLNRPVHCSDTNGLRPVSELERHGEVDIPLPPQNAPTIRDVTEEITDALNKAANHARSARKVAYLLFGDCLASDGFFYWEFYQLVNHKAPWDIKRQERWELTIGTPYPGWNVYVMFGDVAMTPEQLGNFTYGYLGYAYGIPMEHLIAGSYCAAGFPTNSKDLANEVFDWVFVTAGYDLAKEVYGGN